MQGKEFSSFFHYPILLLGCGNTLFGDDGFGPAVIEGLHARGSLPDFVHAADVGTGVRDLLFDLLLSPEKPRQIIILDATDQPGRTPGEIFELAVDRITPEKTNDFSVHQFPSLNLLQELNAAEGVEVRVLAVQVKCIPAEVQPGLSPEVAAAVPRACEWVLAQIGADL